MGRKWQGYGPSPVLEVIALSGQSRGVEAFPGVPGNTGYARDIVGELDAKVRPVK